MNPHRSQMNPHLEQMNPHLEQMNPHLEQVNPHLPSMNPLREQMNPHRSQMNPRLERLRPNGATGCPPRHGWSEPEGQAQPVGRDAQRQARPAPHGAEEFTARSSAPSGRCALRET